ncbi:MAG TPA: EamA family transporter, partial [Phnomibacter sp.]|nr:EamA family transporter [Phnomibacter sp.]
MKKLPLPYLALSLTCIVWGTTWVASKIGIQGVHPLFFAALRQSIAGACYLLFFIAIRKATWPRPAEWGFLLLQAVLLFVASNGLTTWGIKYISSGLGAILGAVFPLFVVIIDWVLGGHQKPNWLSTLGVLLGFAGVAIIFYEHLPDFANATFSFGIILSLVAAFTWAVGTAVASRKKTGLNQYYALGWQMFLAGSMLHIMAAVGGLNMPLQQIPATTWYCLAYMVVFGSIITFGAFIYSLQHLPATLASIYAYINPIVAVVLGHFMLGEAWSLFLLAGALVTLLGVYLV